MAFPRQPYTGHEALLHIELIRNHLYLRICIQRTKIYDTEQLDSIVRISLVKNKNTTCIERNILLSGALCQIITSHSRRAASTSLASTCFFRAGCNTFLPAAFPFVVLLIVKINVTFNKHSRILKSISTSIYDIIFVGVLLLFLLHHIISFFQQGAELCKSVGNSLKQTNQKAI